MVTFSPHDLPARFAALNEIRQDWFWPDLAILARFDHFGHLRAILTIFAHFGTFLLILAHFRSFWHISAHFGTFLPKLTFFSTFLKNSFFQKWQSVPTATTAFASKKRSFLKAKSTPGSHTTDLRIWAKLLAKKCEKNRNFGKTDQIWQKCPNLAKMAQSGQIWQKWHNLAKSGKNGKIWPKLAKSRLNGKFCQKWKMSNGAG